MRLRTATRFEAPSKRSAGEACRLLQVEAFPQARRQSGRPWPAARPNSTPLDSRSSPIPHADRLRDVPRAPVRAPRKYPEWLTAPADLKRKLPESFGRVRPKRDTRHCGILGRLDRQSRKSLVSVNQGFGRQRATIAVAVTLWIAASPWAVISGPGNSSASTSIVTRRNAQHAVSKRTRCRREKGKSWSEEPFAVNGRLSVRDSPTLPVPGGARFFAKQSLLSSNLSRPIGTIALQRRISTSGEAEAVLPSLACG